MVYPLSETGVIIELTTNIALKLFSAAIKLQIVQLNYSVLVFADSHLNKSSMYVEL